MAIWYRTAHPAHGDMAPTADSAYGDIAWIAYSAHGDIVPDYPSCPWWYGTELPILPMATWHRTAHPAHGDMAPDCPFSPWRYGTGLPILSMATWHRTAHSARRYSAGLTYKAIYKLIIQYKTYRMKHDTRHIAWSMIQGISHEAWYKTYRMKAWNRRIAWKAWTLRASSADVCPRATHRKHADFQISASPELSASQSCQYIKL